MNEQYGWRETAGYYIATYFDTFLIAILVLISGSILFEVLGKRWEKRNEKEDTEDTE